ncbi:hypothetical protein D3C76_1167260 [compost metagenome]
MFRNRLLAHLGREANFVVYLGARIFLQQFFHNMLDIPLAHGRLVRDDDFVGRKIQLFDLFFLLDQMHLAWRNAYRAFRLGVSLLPDVDHLIPFGDLLFDQHMGFGYVGASGIHRCKPFVAGHLANLRRYAMGGKNDRPALHLAQNIQAVRAVQRNYPFVLEGIRDMAVVHNHAQYINRPRQIEVLGRLTGQDHRVHDAVAITARRNFNDFHESSPCFLVPQFSSRRGASLL